MKLRNIAAKFASGLLITTMVFSLVACGEKESDDDDKKDKAEVKITVDKLMEDMNAKTNSLSTEKFEKALEDDCITYEEFEDAMKSISSCKAEATFDLDISMEAEADGEKESEKMIMDFTYLMEYDSDNMSFHMGLEADMESSEDSETIKTDIYFVNEDGTYYGYTYSSDDDVTYRREIGNIKEMFGEEGITREQLEELYEEMDMPMDMDEMIESMNMSSDSEYMKAINDQLSLAKEYVEYKGKDYYDLAMNLDTAKLLKAVKDTKEMKDILESMEVESMDELFEMEVTEGTTLEDVLDLVKFKINYYVDPTDLFVAHMEGDLKDCINDCFDLAEKYILETSVDDDVEASIELKCNSAKFEYDFDNDAKVTVKYEGEYEEVSDDDVVIDDDDDWSDGGMDVLPDEGWSGDYIDDAVVVNGNTFDLYNYNDEVIATITIPDGFSVDADLSSKQYVTLYDDMYNEIEVDSDPYYWIEDLMEGKAYEPDLEFYTRDELVESDSIDTNQGKVRVFVSTYSFDENPEENYYVNYTLVLVDSDDMPFIEVSQDVLDDTKFTLEDLTKAMFN